MYQLKVHDTICQIIKMFHSVGLWQYDEESTYRKMGKKFFSAVSIATLLIFLASNSILCDDKHESIYSAQITLAVVVVFVKCLHLIRRKQEILDILIDSTIYHSTEDREEYDQLNKKMDRLMKFVRVFVAMIYVTVVLVIVIKLPFLSIGAKGLPGFISFSWQKSEIIFWLAFVCLSLSIPVCAFIHTFAGLIWYIMMNYSIAYELLGIKFKDLGKKHNALLEEDSFVQRLIALVEAHRNLNE